jgi:hypothetical protein
MWEREILVGMYEGAVFCVSSRGTDVMKVYAPREGAVVRCGSSLPHLSLSLSLLASRAGL